MVIIIFMADLLYRITSDCATVPNEEPESEPVIARRRNCAIHEDIPVICN